jgi:hypothetical protein
MVQAVAEEGRAGRQCSRKSLGEARKARGCKRGMFGGGQPKILAGTSIAIALLTTVAAGCTSSKRSSAPAASSTSVATTTTSVAITTSTSMPATTSSRPSPSATTVAPTAAGCRSGDPLANVYHAYRLVVVKPCMTVSGTVQSVTVEDDGDTHFDLALAPAFVSLLKPANYSGQHGWLVAEIVPADKPGCIPGQPPRPATGTYNYGICTGAKEVAPPVGTHVYVTGPYVLDEDHGGWAEVHPVWQVSTTSAPTPSPTPTTIPPPISPTTLAQADAVRIVSVSSPVAAGSAATLVAQTSPQAACSLSVTLPSGRQSTAQGLGSAAADATGRVQWTWRTGSTTEPGTATATVSCGTASASSTFLITG